jgi:16S rRNA (cytosine967-C5)-methyltransferase
VGVYRRQGPGSSRSGSSRSNTGAAKRDGARRSGNPRRAAYDVLAAVESREAYANLLLPKLLADRDVTGRDAALATELAYGTLRGQGTYDAVLAACSDRPLGKLDPPVRLVLRLGAHQLLSTRIGAHAAVATSVDLIKSVAGHGGAGYVNAVLRRVSTRDIDAWLEIIAPGSMTDHDGRLAIRYSHPRWIVAAYRAALGDAALGDAPPGDAAPGEDADAELEAALAAGNARPRVTMATLPGGQPRDQVMPTGAEPGRWSPYAFTLDSGNPADLIASGQATVQDEASQLAAIALARAPLTPLAAEAVNQADPARGELWLDMCAGPGGKTRLLYGLATTGTPRANLIAAELHPHRAALVAETMTRSTHQAPRSSHKTPRATHLVTTLANHSTAGCQVVVADGTRPPWPDGVFDRVLVDAPCSGLGALRRRPEARWRKVESDMPALAELQRALLRSALAAVRPGGVVAYVTCSPVPAETRDVVTAVVSADPSIEILDAPAALADVPDLRSPSPLFAQLWPHRHGTDAIFIALLRRGTQ